MLTVIFPGYFIRSKVNNGRSLTLLFLEKLAPGRRGIRSTVSGYPLFFTLSLFCRKDFAGKEPLYYNLSVRDGCTCKISILSNRRR